jgi:hypothetical protein
VYEVYEAPREVSSMLEEQQRLVERLEEAGLNSERFIDVQEDVKGSHDHTQVSADEVEGNYGVYATAEDRLLIIDVDDYDELEDRSGLTALSELPATLEQKSPHGGTHRFYAVEKTVDGRHIAAVLKDEFDTAKGNLKPSWGEIRVANQYVVGAGSSIDHAECDDDKNNCPGEGVGHYELHSDREIATISAADILSVLEADPNYTEEEETEDPETSPDVSSDADPQDVLSYAINESNDKKLQRIWSGDYSDYDDDRSRAEAALAYKLGFWLQGDKRAVRRAMNGQNLPNDVSRPRLKKWSERDDDSYRDSVLSAVDKQTDYYDPSQKSDPDPSTLDYSEVERGEAILRAETTPESPAGEMEYRNGCYGYTWVKRDDNGDIVDSGFDPVTNFAIETLSYLDTYEGELFTLRVHPNHPMEDPYEVEVNPKVFNEARDFREKIVCGRTTWFQPSRANRPAQQVLGDLRQTAGSQKAPEHTGTEYIGLHGDDYDEWVTPNGTLTADGWSDEAEYKFYEKGGDMHSSSSLAEKWALDPDDGADYDQEAVAGICEKLPWARLPERGLPVLGWYYSAALKPLVYNEFGSNGERQFNLLQVIGGTGTGKTSTLEMFYELFGANPNPYGCGDKGFTIEKKLSSSCGLPIWLDEYKPTDLAQGKMDWLHRRLREVFRGQSLSKGLPSLGEVTFTFRAPVVFSGEQVVEKPAVRRRTVVTQFSTTSTKGEYRETFKDLQSGAYRFRDHALAYYRYILGTDESEFSALWDAAGEKVEQYLEELQIDSLNEDSEVQGLKTIVFGYEVFKDFAETMGADVSTLPGDAQLRDAIAHVAENIGPDGRRREHIDDFTELVAQAALEEYIQEGVHYRILDSQKHGGKVLAFHMPSTFTAVKRFMRDYNLENEYSLLGKTDFLDNYSDKAADASAYPLGTNKQVRGIENGRRAVYIDVQKASETLGEEFELGAFVETDHEEEGDGEEAESDAVAISDLEARSWETITAEVVQIEPTADAVVEKGGPAESGILQDSTGVVDVVDFDGASYSGPDLEEDQTYRFENVRVGRYDGAIQVELTPATEVTEIQRGVGTTGTADPGESSQLDASEEGATPDGGATMDDDPVPADAVGADADVQRLAKWVSDKKEPLSKAEVIAIATDSLEDTDPPRAEDLIEKACREGKMEDIGGGMYRGTL